MRATIEHQDTLRSIQKTVYLTCGKIRGRNYRVTHTVENPNWGGNSWTVVSYYSKTSRGWFSVNPERKVAVLEAFSLPHLLR